MFNNLYQIEQAGRQQQQYLLDLQRQAEQAHAAPGTSQARQRRPFQLRVTLRRGFLPRSAAWLTRLLVVALALTLGFTARPAAAATDPGTTGGNSALTDPGNASGNQPIADPGNASGNQPIADPGNASGNQPIVDPGNASGNQPVVDPGNASGNQSVVDPGNASGHQPVIDPGNASGHQPARTATALAPSASAFMVALGLMAALLVALTARRRRAATR